MLHKISFDLHIKFEAKKIKNSNSI